LSDLLPQQDTLIQFLNHLSLGIIVEGSGLLLLAYMAIRSLNSAAEIYTRRYERHTLIVRRVTRFVELIVWLGIVPVGLIRLLHPDRDMMLALLGASAVAFGFAVKDLAAGIVASVVVTIDRPFQVGDYIEVGGYAGEVVNVGLRSTTIVSLNDDTITIPNATFLTTTVSNANAGSLSCMVVTDFYLAHESDFEQVKSILWEAAATSKFVEVDQPITVVSRELPYGTRFSAKAYVADHRHIVRFATDVAESAKAEFKRCGISYAHVEFAAPASLNGHASGT
jgi:hypothetical protein